MISGTVAAQTVTSGDLHMTRLLLGASLVALSTAPALAQTTGPGQSAPSASSRGGDIVVTAPVLQAETDVLQGVSILSGEELTRELRPTIGDTLARQPGVSATSFGPAASRPVLRGLQGERIRVLQDGIGSIDVSNTSVDHAVAINPLTAERIEVLRGPSALLFGSSAIGGVVNVIDRRIPRPLPESGYRLDAIGSYGSAANERSGSAAADVALGRHFVLHADGSWLKTDDLEVGGYLLSPQARAAALSQVGVPQGDEPIDFAANAALRDRIPNTASETWTAAGGVSLVTDTGHLGVSYSHYDSVYGVPVRYATAVGQEQEAPTLDIVQDRVDLRAEVETGGGFLDRIRVRAGHATYRHYEIEDTGEIATTFRNNGLEGRIELVQADRGGWRGASGVQYFNRQFTAIGEEAFVPRNETDQVGLFTLQQFDLGAIKAEAGLRYEHSRLTSRPTAEDPERYFRGERSFDAFSGSLGASYALTDGVRIGLNGSHTQRAPSAEELFANGGHLATQAYELGNPGFVKEKSWGLEATLHAHRGSFSFDLSGYHNWFDNFISENLVDQSVCEAAAGGDEVGLPCFQFQQLDARFWGLEADASVALARLGTTTFNLDGVADYTRASFRNDGGPLPRIPPLRLLGGLEAQGERFTARAEVEHVFEQDRIARFETPTDDYTLVNASVSLRPFGNSRTTLLLSANNIFDVVARRHASFLKDFAPLAGRDFRATLRLGL
jgi:iron complex outermembrane recepter protein